ncbi:hypothetical protein Tco_1523499 [Tanacetum coccineum]
MLKFPPWKGVVRFANEKLNPRYVQNLPKFEKGGALLTSMSFLKSRAGPQYVHVSTEGNKSMESRSQTIDANPMSQLSIVRCKSVSNLKKMYADELSCSGLISAR